MAVCFFAEIGISWACLYRYFGHWYVAHVSIHLSKIFHRFLKLPFCSISGVVIGKRVNRGAGDGLEILVEYKFFGDARAVSWIENQIKKTERNVNILVKKMYEIIPIK